MDIGTLLGMTFMLFSGTQPDWTDIAQKLTPASKAEILAEVKKNDELLMEGDSVRVIPGQDPKEYSYTNYYEFTQVFNKWRRGNRSSVTEGMVDAVLPMINVEIRVDRKAKKASLKLGGCSLWHPDGIDVGWYYSNAESKIGGGYKEMSAERIKFVNKFLDEPYIFDITDDIGHKGVRYIGELRDGKMVVYDIDGGRYDGIEDMILKQYGSIEEYIEKTSRRERELKRSYFDTTTNLSFEITENGDTINVR